MPIPGEASRMIDFQAAQLATGRGREAFVSLEAPIGLDLPDSVRHLLTAYDASLAELSLSKSTEALLRLHVSDPVNQSPLLRLALAKRDSQCFTAIVGQAPASGSKLALEAWHLEPGPDVIVRKRQIPGGIALGHSGYETLLLDTAPTGGKTSEQQCASLLGAFMTQLDAQGLDLAQDVLRTWYYLKDIDHNYAGMVAARRTCYEARGLTPKTHFIASTGIEAGLETPGMVARLHTLATRGLRKEQVRFLNAPEHMCPTHVYGVNFERGTEAVYGDRRHIFVSGTASIDHEGKVLHLGDPVRQTERALENVAALLGAAQAELADLKQVTVYLRDPTDACRVREALNACLPVSLPLLLVQGAVCRPEWLVEIEGIAALAGGDAAFAPYF